MPKTLETRLKDKDARLVLLLSVTGSLTPPSKFQRIKRKLVKYISPHPKAKSA